MNSQVNLIIARLQETLDGDPWYGKSVYATLEGIDPGITNIRPGEQPHSAVDLIYHMLTWTEFTLKRIEGEKINDLEKFESLDWREIDPQIHGWEEAVNDFRQTNLQLIAALADKPDEWLQEKVDYRDYNFDTLLRGLIEHHIYHTGQINYLEKTLQ
ncbi:MAG: DinB family protein [Chitinophagaceae bacterium]